MRVLLAIACALVFALPAQAARYHVGDRAGEITGRDALSNTVVSLSDYSGRWVFIDFWATWCGPCMGELPNLLSETASYRQRPDFEIFSVSLDDPSTADRIMEVVREHGIDYPVIYDGGGWSTVQSTEWGIRSIPATYLVDPLGNIVATGLRGEALAPGLDFFINRTEPYAPIGLRSNAVKNEDGSITISVEAYSPERKPLKLKLDYYHMRMIWAEDDPNHEGRPVNREIIEPNAEEPEENVELSFGEFGDAMHTFTIPAVENTQRFGYEIMVLVPGSEALLNGEGLWLSESGNLKLDEEQQ